MSFIFRNNNRLGKLTSIDCTVRAIATALGTSWDQEYFYVCVEGYLLGNMPSGNDVWPSYLMRRGFKRFHIPNTCPDCYTIRDFCKDNPKGTFVIGTGQHAVAVIDGDYYDTWDSGDEIPTYFWVKGED